MNTKKQLQNKQSGKKNTTLITIMLLLGGAIIFYALHLYQDSLILQSSSDSMKSNDINLVLETTITSIAKKFVCVCGNCGELSLDTCTCPDASKEREQIRRSLMAGQTPEQVIVFVNDTYGGMKPEIRNN